MNRLAELIMENLRLQNPNFAISYVELGGGISQIVIEEKPTSIPKENNKIVDTKPNLKLGIIKEDKFITETIDSSLEFWKNEEEIEGGNSITWH